MTVLDEHAAFQQLQESLLTAADRAMLVARFRPDQSMMWEKVAEAITVCSHTVNRLAEESVLKNLKM